jgi:predicted transcriptional regulator
MGNAKQQVESLLHKLPDNCSLEDIQYHLYVLGKVRRGVDDPRQQGAVSREDTEKRLSQWHSQ